MIYRDKALEEIRAIVEQYKLNYKQLFMQELPDSEVINLADLLVKERKEQLFRGVFESMSALNIFQALDEFLKPSQKSSGFDAFAKEIAEAESKDVSKIHITPKKGSKRPVKEKTNE
jgi:hypothetical protein